MGDLTEPFPHAAREGARASHHPLPTGGGLTLLALGVVFGDIGTSPLYAMRESVAGAHGLAPTPEHVLGVLSLVFWSLTMVVTVKYLTFIMRADNHGEGGILALLALVPARLRPKSARIGWLPAMVLFGAALLYGDGIITPAISVLSAVEGLEVATARFKPLVVPLTVVILLALFWVQRRGTAGVGRIFGPIMALWFATLAVLGLVHLVRHPSVLAAINPAWGLALFEHDRARAFVLLGSVVLCITGGEALYADMGHFGRSPIRRAWFAVVFPALLLNYFGQGALLLSDPSAAANPFFGLVPPPLVIPMVALATIATIIASQALISGAYSLTRQAVQLGYFPRVNIVHTSKATEGQIFVPQINAALAVACIAIVLAFGSSGALAAAYGIAVTGTMAITSIVYFVVVTETWGWPVWRAGVVVAVFLVVDLAFFTSNLLKFVSGGWFPIAVAVVLFVVMVTWKRGRAMLGEQLASRMLPIDMLLADVERVRPYRVPATAVFLASNPNGVPVVLLHHFKHNQTLHETVVLCSVIVKTVPEVPHHERIAVRELGHGFFQVLAYYGFMESPNVPAALALAAERAPIPLERGRTTYFLGRETLLATGRGRMPRWQKALFMAISRNARPADQYFGIPPDRVVELGVQIGL